MTVTKWEWWWCLWVGQQACRILYYVRYWILGGVGICWRICRIFRIMIFIISWGKFPDVQQVPGMGTGLDKAVKLSGISESPAGLPWQSQVSKSSATVGDLFGLEPSVLHYSLLCREIKEWTIFFWVQVKGLRTEVWLRRKPKYIKTSKNRIVPSEFIVLLSAKQYLYELCA